MVAAEPGEARVTVAADGRVVAVIVLSDRLREDAAGLVADLRASGIRYVALATGDARPSRRPSASRLASTGSTPAVAQDKLELVRSLAAPT